MVEVIAEDEVVAVYGFVGCEAEGDAVLIVGFGVWRMGEVGGCGWGGGGKAAVVLEWSRVVNVGRLRRIEKRD